MALRSSDPPLTATRTGCRRKTRPDALCFASWAGAAAPCMLAPPDEQGLCCTPCAALIRRCGAEQQLMLLDDSLMIELGDHQVPRDGHRCQGMGAGTDCSALYMKHCIVMQASDMDVAMDLPAPVREAVARSLAEADLDTFAALRLVSRGWQDAADQATRRVRIRVSADTAQTDLPAVAKLLRGLGDRFSRLQEVYVSDSDRDLRPSVTHNFATDTEGRQLSVPGAVWGDMLGASLSAVRS